MSDVIVIQINMTPDRLADYTDTWFFVKHREEVCMTRRLRRWETRPQGAENAKYVHVMLDPRHGMNPKAPKFYAYLDSDFVVLFPLIQEQDPLKDREHYRSQYEQYKVVTDLKGTETEGKD